MTPRGALRRLARRPLQTIVLVASLGVGLGVTTTSVALVDALFLRPLAGVAKAHELLEIHTTDRRTGTLGGFSYPAFEDLRRARSTSVAAFHGRLLALNSGGSAEVTEGQLVSDGFFEVLGARPALGRLAMADDAGGAVPVVLSHALFTRRFGGDPGVLGRAVRINGQPATVVGVAEPGFAGTFIGFPLDVWLPLRSAPRVTGESLASRDSRWLELVGRLHPGTSPPAARDELAGLAREHAGTRRPSGIRVLPATGIDHELRGGALLVSGLLVALAVLLHLVASSNAAAVLLAQASARRHEMAIRTALGATRSRLTAALLGEAALPFALAGGLGVIVSFVLARLLGTIALPGLGPGLRLPIEPDPRILAFTAALTVATGLACVRVLASGAFGESLSSGARVATSSHRLRDLLVAGQIAGSLTALVATGLLLRTLSTAETGRPGLEVDRVLASRLNVSLLGAGADRTRLLRNVLARVRELPGVESAGLVRRIPFSLGRSTAEVSALGPETGGSLVDVNAISEGSLETLGVPVVRGRSLTIADTGAERKAGRAALLSESLARKLFGDAEPLGRTVWQDGLPLTVVGVTRDVGTGRLWEAPRPELHAAASPDGPQPTGLLVRTSERAEAFAPRLHAILRASMPDLPAPAVTSLRTLAGNALLPQRLAGRAGLALGVTGLLLAAAGLYALTSLFVAQGTREVGVRRALGATDGDVVRLVVAESARVAGPGLILGLLGGIAASRGLRGLLVGVSPADPWTFVGSTVLLAAVVVVASAVPAFRAVRLSPVDALRQG